MTEPVKSRSEPTAPGWRLTVPALVLLAGGVRGLAALGAAVIPRDATVYVNIARAVADDGPAAAFAGRQHPLYPLTAGLFGGTELAAILVSIAAGALGAVAVLRIGERLHSRGLGVVAALLYAVAPTAVRFTSTPLLEGLFLPLFLWAVERGLAAHERPLAALFAGVLGGAAYLARPEGLELLVVLPVALLVRRRFVACLVLLAGFLAVGGPYAAWLSEDAGRFTLSRKKPAARFVSAEEGFDAHMEKKSRRTGLTRPSFGDAVVDTARTIGEASTWVLLPLALAGAFLLLRREHRALTLVLLALLAVDLAIRFRLLHLHGYLGRRHMAAAVCMLLPFAAGGLFLIGRRRVGILVGVLVVGLLVLAVRPRDEEKATLKEAGRWILSQSGPGAVVAVYRTPRIVYYAEGTDHFLQEDLDEVRPYWLFRGLNFVTEDADWIALVPGRMPEDIARHVEARLKGLPRRQFGEGKWAVVVWATSPRVP